jgi:hypothetical protein
VSAEKADASPLWGGRGWVSTGLATFDSSRLPQFFTLVPTRTNRVAAEALGLVRCENCCKRQYVTVLRQVRGRQPGAAPVAAECRLGYPVRLVGAQWSILCGYRIG